MIGPAAGSISTPRSPTPVRQLRARGLQVQTKVDVAEQPASAILEDAETVPTDIIAIETHGRGGLSRLFLGSVADKVVRGAHVPVLLHRPA